MDHWTHNEVIPSSGVTPVELIILYLTDLRSTAGMLAWALQLQFPQWPLDVSVAPVVSVLSGFVACEERKGRNGRWTAIKASLQRRRAHRDEEGFQTFQLGYFASCLGGNLGGSARCIF